MSYQDTPELTDETRAELQEIASRYPQARSGLLPMLHLVQSVQGRVTPEGIQMCADVLGLSTAEVAGVETFYTMYKRFPVGKHHVGVCINPGCGILGGDAIWQALSEDLDIGHDETTEDGTITLERIECQAACTHAPVMTVDWEFMDDMTVPKARELVTKLQNGEKVKSTRGPEIRCWRDTERTLAGMDDGLAESGTHLDDKMLAGLTIAKEQGMSAPEGSER